MTKTGIEELYVKISSWFSVLEGYLDDKVLGSIFRMCRLRPYSLTTEQRKFCKHWVDDFGNSVYIDKKKLKVVLNDLSNKRQTTDLYAGLSLGKVAKMSKMAYIDGEFVVMLGLDEYLRAFLLTTKTRCSPLLLGFKTLKVIADNADITYATEKDGYWLTVMPMPKRMIDSVGLEGVFDG